MNKQELIKKYEHMNHDCFRRVDVSEILSDLIRLEKPQKVAIPDFVADWIGYCKMRKISLAHALYRSDESVDKRVFCWVVDSLDNQEIFAKAWLFGYEVEKEKRYTVKIKAVNQYLVKNPDEEFLGFLQSRLKSKFTKKELEEAGFGWVFDCPGVEVQEVE